MAAQRQPVMRAWRVWYGPFPEFSSVENATTAGRAKGVYFSTLRDAWPDTKFTDLRAELIGKPHTSLGLLRCAEYRGVQWVRAGTVVRVGERVGTVVAHDDSENFVVELGQGELACGGQRVHVHPSGLAPVDAARPSGNCPVMQAAMKGDPE